MNGVPLLVIAKNLGHSDTRMVEKHYGHLAESYNTEVIRAGAPRYGVVPDKSVTRLTPRERRERPKTAARGRRSRHLRAVGLLVKITH